jgi:hypothetical protein
MTFNRAGLRTLPAVAVSLFAASVLALAAPPAARAQTPAPATSQSAPIPAGPDPYVEGQIAFMKAALEITPAQEAHWNKVADAMRANSSETQRLYDTLQSASKPPETAVQRIESHVRLAELSVKEGQRFLAAFRPLYASLSKDQKAAADELMGQSEETAAPPPPNEPPPASAPPR